MTNETMSEPQGGIMMLAWAGIAFFWLPVASALLWAHHPVTAHILIALSAASVASWIVLRSGWMRIVWILFCALAAAGLMAFIFGGPMLALEVR